MKVAGAALRCRVEFVRPSIGGNPQIGVIVLQQILKQGDSLAALEREQRNVSQIGFVAWAPPNDL